MMQILIFLMSSAVIIGGAKLFGWLAERLRLPALLGMILFGMLIGPYGFNLLPEIIIGQAGLFKDVALVTVLFIGGLGVSWSQMRQIGRPALLLSSLPALFEGFAVAFVSMWLFGFDFLQGAILGFIIAAVSPAILIPAMVDLVQRRLGTKKAIPQLLLIGACADDSIVITLFTLFLSLYLSRVQGVSSAIGSQLVAIPLMFVVSIGVSWCLAFALKVILPKMQKLALQLAIVIIVLLIMRLAETLWQIPLFNSLLAIMLLGFWLRYYVSELALEIQKAMQHIWQYGRYFLFVFVGVAINPFLIGSHFLSGCVLLAISLTMRSVGVVLSLIGSDLTWRERGFCAAAFIPKATVQSAKAGIPLQAGVAGGELMQALAILSVLITAPLGAIGIQWLAPKLLSDDSE